MQRTHLLQKVLLLALALFLICLALLLLLFPHVAVKHLVSDTITHVAAHVRALALCVAELLADVAMLRHVNLFNKTTLHSLLDKLSIRPHLLLTLLLRHCLQPPENEGRKRKRSV